MQVANQAFVIIPLFRLVCGQAESRNAKAKLGFLFNFENKK